MRILYAVHGYKPALRIGGPAVSVPAIAERLVRRGHDVTVVTSDCDLGERLDVPLGRPVEVEGVQVWYFAAASLLSRWLPSGKERREMGGFLYAPAMAAALPRLVREVDAVHTHLPFTYPTYATAQAAFRAGRPLFYHQRGVFDPKRLTHRYWKKRLYLELIEKPILRRATLLFALTQQEAETYRALGITTLCRIVRNGVDLPREQNDVGRRAELKWRLVQDAPTVIFLGRLQSLKGTRTLLAAFARVHRIQPNARLVMAGPDEAGEEEVLRVLAARAGLGVAVLFPGVVMGDDKALLLARADLLCLPSVAEGFSIAVLEALAAGTAVLLTQGCNFPEIAQAGAGRVVENGVEPLAQALEELLADRAGLAQMGRAGRALVEREYSWDHVVDELVDAYAEGIARYARESSAPKPR